MSKIWQKNNKIKLNPIIEKYNTGDDYIFDMDILPYDIQASKAHAIMLGRIGVLTKAESIRLVKELNNLLVLFHSGKVKITVEDEDCHTVIENFLVEKLGNLGKKIHTGRSRNDQVLVATRLYLLDQLKQIKTDLKVLIASFVAVAKKNIDTVLPGYSHTQQAMPSSVAHWALSHAESLMNDSEYLSLISAHISQNPLGTAAGFGVTFSLDREFVKKELHFDKNIINSLFAQGSRGKFESLALESLAQIMMSLSRFATDMLFFTSRELSFFSVDENLTTGSSIMPQKKNLDSMELVRGNSSVITANQLMIKDLAKGLISGYSRDYQLMKKPVIESIRIAGSSVNVVNEFVNSIKINSENIKKAMKNDIVAADLANELVEKKGVSFRDAYVSVGLELEKIKEVDYKKNIKSKKSLGAPGNLNLQFYTKWLKKK